MGLTVFCLVCVVVCCVFVFACWVLCFGGLVCVG